MSDDRFGDRDFNISGAPALRGNLPTDALPAAGPQPAGTGPDGLPLWHLYPFRHVAYLSGSFHGHRLPSRVTIPTHHATPADVARLKQLGLDPWRPDFWKLKGRLLAAGVRAEDLPALAVSEVLEILTRDELG